MRSSVPLPARACQRQHIENARFAVSLGAAFALLCAVIFDTTESRAAKGVFELLFGGGGYAGNFTQPAPDAFFGGNAKADGRYRHARRSRPPYAYAYARRQIAERRLERKRAAASRVTGRRHVAVNIRRATMRKNAVTIEASSRNGALNPTRAPIAATMSQNAICVRACDGFYFRIAAGSSGGAAQQTCERLCPGSKMNAFLLPGGAAKAEDAVAVGGRETYAQLVARIKPDSARDKSCACPQTAEKLSATSAFLSDLTLRPGDTVVTPDGVRVLRRGSRYPFKGSDFLSLAETHTLPRATRGALAAIDRALKIPYGRLAVASNSERRRHRHNADL